MKKNKQHTKGFTLVELLIAASILVGAVLAFLMLFYNMLVLMEKTKNVTIAVNDGKYVLERIRSTDPFTSTNITTNYPQATDLSNLIGPVKLTNETITVAYVNPAADPIVMTVTVSWTEKGISRNVTLRTAMTER